LLRTLLSSANRPRGKQIPPNGHISGNTPADLSRTPTFKDTPKAPERNTHGLHQTLKTRATRHRFPDQNTATTPTKRTKTDLYRFREYLIAPKSTSVCDMSNPVSSIPNLGPASDASFARAGIATAEQVRDLGAEACYSKLIRSGTKPHFIGFYALVMGLQGRPWNDCQGAEKAALRETFDKIKADAAGTKEKGRSDLEAALDAIGVIERSK